MAIIGNIPYFQTNPIIHYPLDSDPSGARAVSLLDEVLPAEGQGPVLGRWYRDFLLGRWYLFSGIDDTYGELWIVDGWFLLFSAVFEGQCCFYGGRGLLLLLDRRFMVGMGFGMPFRWILLLRDPKITTQMMYSSRTTRIWRSLLASTPIHPISILVRTL